jgi:hypothetical protein
MSVFTIDKVLLKNCIVSQLVRKFFSCLWNPKVHYCGHKSPLLDPVLSHLNPVHTLYLTHVYININIITHLLLHLRNALFLWGLTNSMLSSSYKEGSRHSADQEIPHHLRSLGFHYRFYNILISWGFPTEILYAFLVFPILATCSTLLIRLDLIILIVFCEECKLWSFASPSWWYLVFLSPDVLLKSFILKYHPSVWVLRFLRRWCFKSWSSGEPRRPQLESSVCVLPSQWESKFQIHIKCRLN